MRDDDQQRVIRDGDLTAHRCPYIRLFQEVVEESGSMIH